jgi:hypothetical protein
MASAAQHYRFSSDCIFARMSDTENRATASKIESRAERSADPCQCWLMILTPPPRKTERHLASASAPTMKRSHHVLQAQVQPVLGVGEIAPALLSCTADDFLLPAQAPQRHHEGMQQVVGQPGAGVRGQHLRHQPGCSRCHRQAAIDSSHLLLYLGKPGVGLWNFDLVDRNTPPVHRDLDPLGGSEVRTKNALVSRIAVVQAAVAQHENDICIQHALKKKYLRKECERKNSSRPGRHEPGYAAGGVGQAVIGQVLFYATANDGMAFR